MKVRNRGELLSGLDGTLRRRRESALDLVETALDAVDARTATSAALDRVIASGLDLRGCVVFAFGKASEPMAAAALSVLPRGGLVLCRSLRPALSPFEFVLAGHPFPRSDAAEQGRRVLDLARSLGPPDVALCLVSGGGSAMLELPRQGVDLAEIERTVRRLSARGAPIEELNAARTRLSQLKGGGLARALAPATVVNLVLVDIPGGQPEAVASGPTMAPGVSTWVIADNQTAVAAVAHLGLVADETPLRGEAREAGPRFYDSGRGPARVAGGETTVTVTGSGRGGRNLEFVLGCADRFGEGLVLSFGTDGVDGASDAAGALMDGEVLRRASELGLEPSRFLRSNDSHRFFDRAGGLIRTGPTGTNVADVALFLP